MKSKLLFTLVVALSLVILTSGTLGITHNSNINGYTTGCSCHSSATTSATNIYITGIPTTVVAGHTYKMSLTIASANAQNWGFDMGVPTGMGVFATTNPHAKATTSGKEVRHYNSAPVAPGNSYTFDSITWTAPATAGSVTFSYAGLAGNNNGGSSGDKVYKSTFTTAVVLPVSFGAFTIEKTNKKVALNWRTLCEIATDHFEVEKSMDGKTFTTLTSVKSKGNTNIGNAYSVTDALTSYADAVYYRIKSVDIDGKTNYSEVKSIVNAPLSNESVAVYPNPVNAGSSFTVSLNAIFASDVTINTLDMTGKVVNSTKKNINKGLNNITVETNSRMTVGNYVVSIQFSNQQQKSVNVPIIIK